MKEQIDNDESGGTDPSKLFRTSRMVSNNWRFQSASGDTR